MRSQGHLKKVPKERCQMRILLEIVDSGFRFQDLPMYDGTKDPREHVVAFDLVMNLYGQTEQIKAKLFKFSFYFASKRKDKWSATYLFTIRQRDDEILKSSIGGFSNEILEVQDLRIDMMVSILILGLKKGLFASALARDPPGGTEQLMELAQKYIDEEEMNAMKDNEWTRDQGRMKGERSKE
ncbi:UNVERIFIED_CONTAM: hypothetical protein Sindi_3130200, partial [Sesamum indicum]